MNTQWNIRFYKTRDGKDPVSSFILGLPVKDQVKVLRTIRLLEAEGVRLTGPHSKAIQGERNLYELRVILGNNIQRVFYYLFDGSTFVLLHGFTKKTQKTPSREIATAISRREDDIKQQEEPHNG
jgi:phage-related protein